MNFDLVLDQMLLVHCQLEGRMTIKHSDPCAACWRESRERFSLCRQKSHKDFLSVVTTRHNKLWHFISDIMDYFKKFKKFSAGEDQQQTIQPNNQADCKPLLVNL